MEITAIHRIQGPGLHSPLAGQEVLTRGVVIGVSRKGYFVQDPDGDPEEAVSHGLFVFGRRRRPPVGSLVEVVGKVIDYEQGDNACPTTQLIEHATELIQQEGPHIDPVWLTADRVLVGRARLAEFLNHLEGQLVGLEARSTFVAPSNAFGDYVVLPPDADLFRTQQGGVLIDPDTPDLWLPGFRLLNYSEAPAVNVGATLLKPVIGPLNFRVASYQIAASGPIHVEHATVQSHPTSLRAGQEQVTVLTLNGFNLDTKKEDPAKVKDARRDVDDDLGDGRFDMLGTAIVEEAASPLIVALQEIQDDDGAELTEVVSAERTYAELIRAVHRAGGPAYEWVDIPPVEGADGGQPGGNIRNGFFYDPDYVSLVEGSLQRLGADSPAFEGSRKPLTARFRLTATGGELEVINVHLASKRHQHGIFAPEDPGFDPRLMLRVQQVEVIGNHLAQLREQGVDYYVTGDFNDFEFSQTLHALTGDHSTNLVDRVPAPLRFDYNHRGQSQALMHGVVANRQLVDRAADYEMLHANALEGARPGRKGEKPSDHAYVIARLDLVSPRRRS